MESTKAARKRAAKKKPKAEQGGGTPPPSKPASKPAKPQVAKTKGQTAPAAPKQVSKWEAAKNNVDHLMREIYGDTTAFDEGSDSDSDEGVSPSSKVLGDLSFDRVRLTYAAQSARADARKLKKGSSPKAFSDAEASLTRLTDRLANARRIRDRIAQIRADAAQVGTGIQLTDTELRDAWTTFQADMDAADTTKAEGSLTAIESRLVQIRAILTAYNLKIAPSPAVGRIPPALLTAAGTVNPLVTLTAGLAHVPVPVATVGALTTLLSRADKPEKVPGMIGMAAAAGVTLTDVYAQFLVTPTGTKVNASRAEAALKAVSDSGRPAAFFLTGPGGQRWDDLRFAGEKNAPVWDDADISPEDVHYGPDGPSWTLDNIIAAAQEPEPGKKKLRPLQQEDPSNPRFMTKSYGNLGVKGCMILPYVDDDGNIIRYTEYDIRPYQGTKRGRERVVVGDDGRKYYTADHYKTFQEIR
jgi:hypothetical protein